MSKPFEVGILSLLILSLHPLIKKQQGIIAQGGMGGFLNPPHHPEHTMHVQTNLRRKPENRDCMSLSQASYDNSLTIETRKLAKSILENWEATKLPLEDSEIQEWILQVLGYFKSRYYRPYSSVLMINARLNPLANSHIHRGVAHIREFYPQYVPTMAHFEEAYWG